jgi:outer membrane receptor for ferrienterochelin and colicins
MNKFLINIYVILLLSTFETLSKEKINLFINVYDLNNAPIPNCRIVASEPKQVAFTNKNGQAILHISPSSSIKLSLEKLFYNPLDTIIILNPNLDTILINLVLKEKEFHSREVVVTATRTDKELLSISLPISTYSKNELKLVNAKKLDEMLLELTDIPLVDDHGRGIQLQGLDPDYTLLLVNGEPMVNRTGGILDISRISVGNVNRIEIVKGPSSSIYGSNALAGVVNIITSEPENEFEASVFSKYASHNSIDLIGEYKQIIFEDKFSFTLFAHRFTTDGYSIIPNPVGKTVPELTNHTFQLESFLNLTQRSKIRFSLRANFESEDNKYLAKEDTIDSKNNVSEISSYLFYRNTLSEKFNYEFRTYFSNFETHTTDKYTTYASLFDEYKFSQNILKIELQTNYLFTKTQYLTVGAGFWTEQAKSLRIAGGKERTKQLYLYLQDDINLSDKLNLIGSFRIDDHSEYSVQFNPKVSASYKITPNLVIRGSIGTGFKAPNFEELYLDWTNPMAGYSVFGRTYIIEGLKKLQETGQIATLLLSPDSLPSLEPEKSVSFDLGGNFSTDNLFIKINIFRNNVSNLIDFLPVANKTNGQRLHTYQNLVKIFTQGIELMFEYTLMNNLKLNLSYQYLVTGDINVINKIKENKIFKRDIYGNDLPVKLSDYGGLFHRPQHSANIRISHYNEKLKLFSSIRANIKSKYGYKDINGNMILDDEREYAPGYAIFNWNISKEVFDKVNLTFGINNVFDKKDVRFLASNPGRTFYISLNFNYVKH